MRLRLLVAFAIVVLVAPAWVHATPVTYDMTFTASNGLSGVGSFVWDEATQSLTGFNWNFDGMTGGIYDSFWEQWGGDTGTLGQYAFELFTGQDSSEYYNCSVGSFVCRMPVAGPTRTYGWPTTVGGFWEFSSVGGPEGITRAYGFDFSGSYGPDGYRGILTATPVPEPGTLVLLGLGLAGLGMSRRRKA